MSEITLLAWKDHPLGGFRLWERNGKFYAEVIYDQEAISESDPWGDVRQWVNELPSNEQLEKVNWMTAEELYPFHYRFSEESHAHWNVCLVLQDFLPCNI